MTELGVFGVTIRCHPGLDPGSVPRTNNLDAQRRNEETVFPKDGFMVWDEGPRTALPGDQQVLLNSSVPIFAFRQSPDWPRRLLASRFIFLSSEDW